jgi:hypothetical protein
MSEGKKERQMLKLNRLQSALFRFMRFLVLLGIANCNMDDRRVDLSIDEKYPLSFILKGTGRLKRLSIYEVPPEKRGNWWRHIPDNDILLWKISNSNSPEALEHKIALTYGIAPSNYPQEFPKESAPAKLVEDKLYLVVAENNQMSAGIELFIIKNGKAVIVSYKDYFTTIDDG